MTSVTIGKYIDVDIDVDLADFETKDLQDELVKRKVGTDDTQLHNGHEPHPLTEIYYAFKFGLNDRAMDLTRSFVSDAMGVVL